ncbi:ABC-F family ATP-binding cassette domain-containing protein [Prolixibacter sp. NT017]|uniref:ABC-F family ATP-binding cassette domain-containing protein n=1 Tax=Prolixibacter sp. NT017 TaxID=2652390 RepID=UPI00126ABDA1|nr:ABC-F family ATP-binding cassette domain-containing protein [Prolixibacter sp. NT017]GET23841.1 ABC transporter ATP-binding protein [Prolixibacter sp. NT017]
MISVEDLHLEFGGFELFKQISFVVNPRDRIGLVGRNGAGKSTLLKIFSGQMQPSSGRVVKPGDFRIGYLPQHMVTADGKTVMEEAVTAFDEIVGLEKRIEHLNHQLATREDYESEGYHKIIEEVTEANDRFQLLGGGNFHADIEQTLVGLGFKRSDFNRQTTEFSGGWRMRIELAKILLAKPNVFLLDEPTNHLDIESIQWLENFLKDYAGAVVLVSHDRAFLDNVTNRTVEISLGNVYDYKVSYSKYVELRKERREQQMAAYRNQQKMIQDTEDFIERFRYKATKAVQVQSRIKQLEKIDRIEIDEEDVRSLNIKFPPSPRSGTVVFEAKQMSKSYGDNLVLKDVDLTIERGNRVAFVGKNGEGKTTLARIIMQELEFTGHAKLGHNVKIGYFAQNQASLLDESATAFDIIDRIAVGDVRTKIRDILGAFMFSGEDVDKKVKVLSGGERSRLAMIRLLLEPVNFLVLDEPTNHLDMHSKDILKQALQDYDGTLLLVSHDREFLDGLVDVVYEFRDKKVKQHLGGIYEFLRRKKMDSLKELERKNNQPAQPVVEKEEPKNDGPELSYEERKEVNRTISRLEKQLSEAESKITSLETEIEEMDGRLANPDNEDMEQLLSTYSRKKEDLDKEMENWEKTTEELEEWNAKKTW